MSQPTSSSRPHRSIRGTIWLVAILVSTNLASSPAFAAPPASAEVEFFERHVRPVLAARCHECHGATKQEGGLRLDWRGGWKAGGDFGASIVPGQPQASLLLQRLRHADEELRMPKGSPPLAADVVAKIETWIARGAADPRDRQPTAADARAESWQAQLAERRQWWSMQPRRSPAPPAVKNAAWSDHPIDRFILAELEARQLQPAAAADRHQLARRLSFALTGLPPTPDEVSAFVADTAPQAYERYVARLLASPHFGERWARHWMDVVHYTDTHGYEWDAPAKNAWQFRDYLTRAFNDDISFRQLILEQLAGDLIPPRIDSQTGLNAALIGPMAMRLGERRHGDSSQVEGVTQEAIANIIDTVSKGFLATTIGCAQCHDHKLDAVAQRDYYAIAGVLMSSRWGVRAIDAADPNVETMDELRRLKADLKRELARNWQTQRTKLVEQILPLQIPGAAKLTEALGKTPPAPAFPDSLRSIAARLAAADGDQAALSAAWKKLAAEFATERERRVRANQENLKLVADFTTDKIPAGWHVEGFGMTHGQTPPGELIVAEKGNSIVTQLLPAGCWSHRWSSRLAGAVRTPLLDQHDGQQISIGYVGGAYAAQSLIVDHAFHCERMAFLNQPVPSWLTLRPGGFTTLAGSPDTQPRRVFIELATKSLNNYFPPRTGYGGLKESDANDPSSWFGVTRAFRHAPGKSPQDELARFSPLFAGDMAEAGEKSDAEFAAPRDRREVAERLTGVLFAAVDRWSRDAATDEDARLLQEALTNQWLANDQAASPELAALVTRYREVERRLQPDHTIGSVADLREGRNERIGVRGSYTEFGDEVPRDGSPFLQLLLPRNGATAAATAAHDATLSAAARMPPDASGRLELAQQIASPDNPLTARVFVNRVWHYLFGEGLVRTPDDFGHLGETPSHPELLDYLATRFVADGWSLKKLVTLIVTSRTWQQSNAVHPLAQTIDPENRFWHHMPLRRLEAEAVRDALLAVSGRLDRTLYGRPIEPHRTAQDAAKRLFSGPVDGQGRRSLYVHMTLMEPPRFLALFNQPLPKLTTGKRDVTNVPDQALALLNDPFVVALADHWSGRVIADGASVADERLQRMFVTAFARPPRDEELKRFVRLVQRSAELRGVGAADVLTNRPVWADVAHAIFNLKEFLYVR